MSTSDLEQKLAFQIGLQNIPQPVAEHRFHPKRRWRFDLAWPEHMLAVEVEGGVWTSGRHSRGTGYIADCEKYNEATLAGWRVLRVTGEHIDNGAAVDWIRRALVEQGAEVAPF